ncbi:MAG: EF-Tu/IF-2/RF-3 family GTPase, partial [Candidatus Omnitrophica bacterium]|nr:EF-Tu/IF-2/RF-3 family GTPase [Candidatus Omnitrophota bacterium]
LGPLIFPVQDVYKIGDRRIVAGKVQSGLLKKGLEVKVMPGLQSTRIKTVELFMSKQDTAAAGECAGFTTEDPVFIDRGDIIAQTGHAALITDSFRASVFWLSTGGVKTGDRISFRCSTQSQACTIARIIEKINSSSLETIGENPDSLRHLEVADVLIKTKKPVVITLAHEVQELGRFVLADSETIVAGGIIKGMA